MEFSLVLEDLQNVLAIFGQGPGVHQDVIYEPQYKVEVLSEHLVHKILEYGGGVDKPIRHNAILVMACRCHEGGLTLVLLMYPEDVVNALEVHRALDGGRINGKGLGIGMFSVCNCPTWSWMGPTQRSLEMELLADPE